MSVNSFSHLLTPGTLTPLALSLANHLWQSTLVAGVIGLLTLTLRRNHARTRYALWLVASIKFLVPFSLLMLLGGQLASLRPSTPQRQAATKSFVTIEQLSQPFTNLPDAPNLDLIQRPAVPLAETSIADRLAAVWDREPRLPLVLGAAWLLGFLIVVARWTRRWRRISAAIQLTIPLREGCEFETLRRMERLAGLRQTIELRSLPASMEPGIFGFFRPILLWPQAITGRLEDMHLEAVLAHEVCHVRRCDNLTAAIHMVVEALFWFHPLVWWIERRLIEERERACDEEVLLLCNQPRAYAESILKVCELCLESPLACVCGISGADLKRRIRLIMTASIARKLGLGARLLLLSAGIVAVGVPIMLGQMNGARVVAAVKASEHAAAGAMSFAARAWSPIEPESFTPSNTLIALQPVREFQMKEPVKLAEVEAAFAQTGKQTKPLTNADVIEMSRAGVPESTIVLAIQNTPSKFDVSAEGILALHAAGITEPVLNQMLRAAKPQQKQSGPEFGLASGSFPVSDAAGKTVRFSAWIKTENVRNGFAGLWWRVDGPGEGINRPVLAFDNSQSRFIEGEEGASDDTLRGATGTTPWTHYQFELPVDKTASNINFGVLFSGTGAAWVDAMKVELDGEPYSNPKFDFDFESPKAKGFYVGCGGNAGCDYKVGIDATTSYSGHQSLKMQFVGDEAARSTPVPVSSCVWPDDMKTNAENLNFADGAVGSGPKGWEVPQMFSPAIYEAINVPAEQCDGSQQCATVHSLRAGSSSLTFLYQNLDVTQHRGQSLVYRAFVRVDPRQKSVARMLVRLHRKDCSTTFRDDMGNHPVTSGNWSVYEIRAPIANDAYHMEFGLQLIGQGAAWIDHMSMEYTP